MGKRKGKAASVRKQKWEEFLSSPQTLAILASVAGIGFDTPNPLFTHLLEVASTLLAKELTTPADLLDEIRISHAYCTQVPGSSSTTFVGLRAFDSRWKEYTGCSPTHWQKRWHVHELGLDLPPYSAASMISGGVSRNVRPFQMKFVQRTPEHGVFKRYHHLYDGNASAIKSYSVNSSTGFYAVPADDFIFILHFAEEIRIELVVIRDVAAASSLGGGLYTWLTEVVHEACNERRNVRPTHPGHMAQFGLNAGARHVCALGQAKSYTKDLDQGTRINHDTDVIGAVSITWSLIRSVMPIEVLGEVDRALELDGMPRLATRDVCESHGFHIKSNGVVYTFPTAERAPPEAYLAVGYQAWAFASCVSRVSTPEIVEGGENFVDASLRVVVHHSYMHGTTRTLGATNTMMSITFSKRVSEAWAVASALEKAQVVAGSGAGPNDEHANRSKKKNAMRRTK
ncbi:hypothetical protein BJ912DRAFT_1045174 [Pholiota molesta]|nr:hypothetical protein BJ912DRAFT_1045174 [Pholiota molesta]